VADFSFIGDDLLKSVSRKRGQLHTGPYRKAIEMYKILELDRAERREAIEYSFRKEENAILFGNGPLALRGVLRYKG